MLQLLQLLKTIAPKNEEIWLVWQPVTTFPFNTMFWYLCKFLKHTFPMCVTSCYKMYVILYKIVFNINEFL